MPACKDITYVLDKLSWMRAERIWPNGQRYTWTDAFGVVLLVSLYAELGKLRFLDEAEWVVSDVDRVLGRPRGIRIGEAPDRDGQYFHYLAMWLYALSVLARYVPAYRRKGVDLVHQIHPAFVVPGRGVVWKMKEDLSAPYPGFGFGALDAFDGYVSYRCLDEHALAREIAEMRALIDATAESLNITQDLGLGMMLWLTHFFPAEDWAAAQRRRSLAVLDLMWREDGYFCREPNLPHVKFAFTNYGVSIGLQSVEVMTERVSRLNIFFDHYRSGDEYDREAITHVMACNSHFPGYLIRGSLVETKLAIFLGKITGLEYVPIFGKRFEVLLAVVRASAYVTTTMRSAIVTVSHGIRKCTYLSLSADGHLHASCPGDSAKRYRGQAEETHAATATARIVAPCASRRSRTRKSSIRNSLSKGRTSVC